MSTRRAALKALAAAPLALSSWRAGAQDSQQVITVLVGAGTSMDVFARLVADQLQTSLKRPAIVVSKLGAGQRVALGEARRAAPDGRTLIYATSGPFAIYPHIYTKLDYDPDRDFTPIAGITTFDVAISTGPMTGATDLKQLIAWARAQGDRAVFGSAPGNGSLSHFMGISLNLATGLKMTHVPYKDSGVGLLDVAGGRLPIMITGLSGTQAELHAAGKIRILAVSGEQRAALAPDVPTLKEAGFDMSSSTSTGLFGPAKMAPDLVARLYDAVQPIFAPALQQKFVLQGMTPWPRTGAQFAASMVEERKHFQELVKASGYVPEPA